MGSPGLDMRTIAAQAAFDEIVVAVTAKCAEMTPVEQESVVRVLDALTALGYTIQKEPPMT